MMRSREKVNRQLGRLRVAFQVLCGTAVVIFAVGCPGFPPITLPQTDVTVEPESGRVSAPGTTIVSEGDAFDGAVGVSATGLVAVIKDGQTYLYHPALGSANLTEKTSRRAVGAFLAESFDGGAVKSKSYASVDLRSLSIANSETLATGVVVRRTGENTYEFTNPKKRWVAIKAHPAGLPVYLPPRESPLETNLIRALGRVISPAGVQLNSSVELNVGVARAETYAATARALGPLFDPATQLLVRRALREKVEEALQHDAPLFVRLNALDYLTVQLEGVRSVVGLVPLDCVDALISDAAVGAFEAQAIGMLTGDESAREAFAQGVAQDVVQSGLGCLCDVVTGGACEAANTLLDILSLVNWVVDDNILGAWDVLTNRAFADIEGVETPTDSDGENQPPVADSRTATVQFETARVIALTATDPDNGPHALTYSIGFQPSHGDLTGAPPSVTYTPVAGYSGSDSLTFKAFDGHSYSNVATVSISVLPQGTQTGDLNVTVRNANNNTVAGAIVKRYDTNWGYIDQKTANGSGVASWFGIEASCYNLEAWYNGEYWINDTNACVPAGGTKSHILKRNEPYAYNFKVIRTDTNTDVTGDSVSLGTPLLLEVEVTNGSPVSRLVRVQNLRLDRSGGGVDYDWDLGPHTINGSSTRTFTVNVTPSNTGTYYRLFDIETSVNSNWVKTDSWALDAAVTITTSTGNLNVTVRNVSGRSSGSTVSGATVVRYTSGRQYIDERTTNPSGVASWSNVTPGTYNLEVYYNGEYWVNDSVSVTSGQTTNRTLVRNEPHAYDFKVLNGSTDVTGGSVPTGTALTFRVYVRNCSPVSRSMRVKLWVDRNQSSSYDFSQTSSSQTVSSGGGTAQFNFSYTPTNAGTYYRRLEVETFVNGNWAMTDSWAWGTAVAVTQPAQGNLNVTVRNVSGCSSGSTVSGATVVRYTSGWQYIDERTTNPSGVASWSNVTAGTYNLEVYYNGEYWVNDSVSVTSGQTTNRTLVRNEPHAYDFKVTVASNGQDVTGGSVAAGTQLRLKICVRNCSPIWRDVRIAGIKVDRNQQSPWDGYLSYTSPQSVGPNGSTREFTVLWSPSNTGTYYRSFETQTDVNGSWVKTDSWSWGVAVSVY